ncbi:MAG: GGDEF domain-containing protein [Candidatus Thiodiazotropha sp. (ex Dulcina madagascariensis)]|nr:GGDEF domain-containing protein [Candidatus Thiodiazotropha sp. (ex Dulcina madagascariensis)]MCU7937208.1 GGDEF domain-containing protein [Candidatus Thiodiazotropha sp. (ex Dulcina madagascariensis)]
MKRTDKTLLEQMQISDVDISHRIELLDLDKNDLDLLSSHKSIIDNSIDDIIDEFYEKQTKVDEISLLIRDSDTLRRLRYAQRKYIIDLFSGHYDGEYVNNRLRIGMVHKRIGVDPKLFLSAIMSLKYIVINTLSNTIEKSEILNSTVVALDKLLYFDTTLVFDTYIDSLVGEIEAAKRRTEIYANSLEDKVAERTRQLEELAKLDPLTNIYNQRAMQELLRREMTQAKRRHTILSLVYFDVDNFKTINDTHGHIKGDEVLKFVGQILLENVRETDVPCRYGGDEFCLILPECNIENAMIVCQKIIKAFNHRYSDFSISMGIAQTNPEDYIDEERLIKIADEKMYSAKKQNGSQIRA